MTIAGAALSEHPLATHAVGETVGHLLEVGGPRPDLVAVFATDAHRGVLEDVVGVVRRLLEPRVLVGATAQSVLGPRRAVGDRPGLSVLACWFGGVALKPVRLGPADRFGSGALAGLRGVAGTLVLLTDPFSATSRDLVADLARIAPGLAVVGAGASAGRRPGTNRLLLDDRLHDDGAVGVLIDPAAPVATVVSQGTRPLGDPFTVTRSGGRQIVELAGRPALERLREVVEAASDPDRGISASDLSIGWVLEDRTADAARHRGEPEVLVCPLIGTDRSLGSLAVGEDIPVGATVRFQRGDDLAARQDLAEAIDRTTASAALCFTDLARRSATDPGGDRDAEAVGGILRAAAVAGMCGAGTIGPVGGSPRSLDGSLCALLVDPRVT